MPATFSFGKIQFDVSLGNAASRARREPDAPFLMAILGDFSGRANRGVTEALASRRPALVDCDNFDAVFAKTAPSLRLPSSAGSSGTMELRFESLDDFHPDQLLKRVPALAELLDVRKRLNSASTSAAAVAEAQRLLGGASVNAAAQAAAPAPAAESIQETMARLLGGTPPAGPQAAPSKPASGGVDINALIKGIVAPSVVPDASPEQTATLSAIEVELARRLRGILHHPDFQSLEANWRGLDLLVRAHGGEDELKLYFLDVSKAELAADLKAQENLAATGFARALQEKSWATLIGAFTFSGSVEDIETLGRIAKISAVLGATFVAGASEVFVGCDSLTTHPDPMDWTRALPAASAEAWAALRLLPEAAHLGLVVPRVLLRQPYGKGSDPIESLPFEELPGVAQHESFLWGCGAFVCGYLLADAFRGEGWEFTASGSGELDDLPVFKFTEDGETKVQPCAEAWLSERTGERILGAGLMPLLSIRGRGAVRLANLQSVAQAPGPLSIRRP